MFKLLVVLFTINFYFLFRGYDPGRREKINLNVYFYTSLRCLKRFYDGLHKTFRGITKRCENKYFKLIFILIQLSEMHMAGKVNSRRGIWRRSLTCSME